MVEDLPAAVSGGAFGDVQQQAFPVDLQMGTAWSLDDLQPVPNTPDVVRLPRGHLAGALALGGSKPFTLLLDPGQPRNHGEAYPVVVELGWRGNPHPAQRWVDADVQVLDVLVDDVDVDAANGQVGTSGTHAAPSPDRRAR